MSMEKPYPKKIVVMHYQISLVRMVSFRLVKRTGEAANITRDGSIIFVSKVKH